LTELGAPLMPFDPLSRIAVSLPLIPIRFGASTRQLFGMLHPPSGASNRGHTVLLCNPFGQEAIRCHRMLRVLGERLSREGFHVMRFDYFGTGDSDGDDAQCDLATWADDVVRVNDEAARLSGNRRSSWFGLRLGASLAAMASARVARAPELLVLWDPVVSGTHYLAELAAAHSAELKAVHGNPHRRYPAVSADCLTEALGFPLSSALLGELRALSVDSFSTTRAGMAKLLQSPRAEDATALAERLGTNGIAVDLQQIDTHIVWASDEAMNTAIVPAEPMQAIVAAFLELR